MDFNPNKTLIKIIKKVHLVVLIFEIFILVLMKGGTKIHGKKKKIFFKELSN